MKIAHSSRLIKSGFLFILCLTLFNACKKEEFVHAGALTGYVKIFDDEVLIPDDLSGVEVKIADKVAYSDKNGRYQVNDLIPGVYPVNFSLPGYSSYQQTIAVINGPDPTINLEYALLGKIPAIDVHDLEVYFSTSGTDEVINIDGVLSNSFSVTAFRFYFGYTPEVSLEDNIFNFGDTFGWNFIDGYLDCYECLIRHGSLNEKLYMGNYANTFSSDTLYLTIYASNPICRNDDGYVKAHETIRIVHPK